MGGMFSGPPAPPPLPPPPPPPTVDDRAVREAAEQSQRDRRGRASTMLTDPQNQREAEQTRQSYLTGA